MGNITHQEPCPKCREEGRDSAGDNLCVYEDHGATCHACGYFETPEWRLKQQGMQTQQAPQAEATPSRVPPPSTVERWPIAKLVGRGYSLEASKFYGVRVKYVNEAEYAYAYPSIVASGEVGGYHIRKLPKVFMRSGEKPAGLFGQHCVPAGGKMVVITEGQDDTLAAYDLLNSLGKKYRVVGSWGTNGWKCGLEYLETFEKVIIAFDQDSAGQDAAKQLADALTPGKGHIATWKNGKDATDLLHQNRAQDFYDAIGNSRPQEMGGIIKGFDAAWAIIKDYRSPEFVAYPEEWQDLGKKAQGLRRGEISVWTAGSSIGKTSFMRRIKQNILHNSDWTIADVELEEKVQKTIRGMMQFEAGKKAYDCTPAEWEAAARRTYGTGRIVTLDHRANRKGKDLIGKFRHLHHAEGADIIFLDHVTLGVREFGEGNEGQDAMMEEFLCFVEQTGCHLALISHLRKSPGGGKSWSQGAIPSEEDMKGSGSLYQIAFDIIGMSRNKQHEDEYIRNVTQLHLLKCRETGDTGPADKLWYNGGTGLIEPADIHKMEDMFDQDGEQPQFMG